MAATSLSRTIYGARISLIVAISVVCGCGITGFVIGMLAGYAGGWFDRVVNLLLINAFLSFPGILLAIAFAAFFGPGISKVIMALVITGWAGYARLARAQVLKVKELEFILAARSLGRRMFEFSRRTCPKYSAARIDSGHHRYGRSDFRGSDAQFPRTRRSGADAKLGRDAERRAQPSVSTRRIMVIFPALAVMLAVLAFNLLGDAWRDWLDPRTRSQMAVMDLTR